jgi:hypothetical protein
MKLKLSYLPFIIILIGVLFSLYLQWQVPDGVFFSGDGGLKALLAQQLSAGHLRFDLIPPEETWVRNLWDDGLYPYQEPFVYQVANHYYLTFPFTFPLVTAPFYAFWGFRGLYLIPLVSTWMIWGTFYMSCRALKLNSFYVSLGLIILIFASPLTLYSAMYWEHTLAVALAFTGVAILLISQNSSGLSRKNALLSGVLIGLSAWFRPEFLCLVFISIVLVFIASLSSSIQLGESSEKLQLQKLGFLPQNKEIFIVSILSTVGLFFLCNEFIYHHPLGIHGIQVTAQVSLSQKMRDAWNNFREMGLVFMQYFPIAYFPILYVTLAIFKRRELKLTVRIAIVYLICFFFTVGVAIIVPTGTAGLIPGGKQWGVRFLLILIPIISLLAIKELSYLRDKRLFSLRYIAVFLISVLLVIGIYKNTYAGIVYLDKTHQGILPAIEFLQKDNNQAIAISHQFVGQALEASIQPEKFFFLVEDKDDLIKLARTLLSQNQKTFTYMCYPFRPCQLPKEKTKNLKFKQDERDFLIKFLALGKFGNYPIYEISIVKN